MCVCMCVCMCIKQIMAIHSRRHSLISLIILAEITIKKHFLCWYEDEIRMSWCLMSFLVMRSWGSVSTLWLAVIVYVFIIFIEALPVCCGTLWIMFGACCLSQEQLTAEYPTAHSLQQPSLSCHPSLHTKHQTPNTRSHFILKLWCLFR